MSATKTTDRISALEDRINRLMTLLESQQVQSAPTPEPTVSNRHLTLAEVKERVKAMGQETRGKVTTEREAKWRAMLGETSTSAPEPNVPAGSSLFIPTMSAKERDSVAISSEDAEIALRSHPKRQQVLKVTPRGWAIVRAMGKNGTTNPNPAGINGFDRMRAHNLALKPGSSAKVWTLYHGANILLKLDAATFNAADRAILKAEGLL